MMGAYYYDDADGDDDSMDDGDEEDDESTAAAVAEADYNKAGGGEPEEEIMAAVVVDDDDDDDDDDDGDEEDEDDIIYEDDVAVAVPEVVEAPAPAPRPKKAKVKVKAKVKAKAKAKTPKKKKGGTTQKKKGGKGKGVITKSNRKGAANNVKKKKKKKTATTAITTSSDKEGFSGLSAERLDAVAKARAKLVEAAPSLPLVYPDIHVRSFGRLFLEPSTSESKFSKTNALYPVGYSCDRYEFSPIHGRILKLRCSILDGKKVKEIQAQMNAPVATTIHDGPVFRIMWGQGIDEDVDDVEYPYDPYAMSPPLTPDKVDAVAIPTTPDGTGKPFIPRLGMRVKSVFDRGQVFHGTITRVGKLDEEAGKKRKRKQVKIEIEYDDGSTEAIMFPDPDVSLLLPEAEPEVDREGNLEYRTLHGLPVHTVIGFSPIEAWGKLLVSLGLTDEIMTESAVDAMISSRHHALKEAKGKMESKYQRKSNIMAKKGGTNDSETNEADSGDGTSSDGSAPHPSDAEEKLRAKVATLRNELDVAKAADREAAVKLADKRISALGSYLCNPFPDTDAQPPQQSSWLALAVKKEKTKMGSTGNKKKIVTATDLLERNDTFFNSDIEILIEGLPGSEYCASYIFQSMRSGGVAATNRAWVHEAQVRSEKEFEKRMKAVRKEKKAKVAEVAKSKEEELRELKRKQRDDLRDERKRLKEEEEEEKKRARIEERLSRLNVQVEDRLIKEACFQREKAIVALAKSFTREYQRRRRAAELVAGQSIADDKRRNRQPRTTYLPLPKISKFFDEDVVRVWDFISTFGGFFMERGFVKALPTMDSLQSAIDSLRGKHGEPMPKEHAITFLTNLAVALCKPLAASQTRLLFASVIALYPALQKDFGAAYFNDINELKKSDKKDDGESNSNPPVLLPVDAMTWQEIARIAFLSDALGELGYSRQDTAHLLRGYRSGGHPNSKEARRLRRVEDFSVALLRQALSDGTQVSKKRRPTIVRIEVPTTPSCSPSDWIFYLHTVRYMKSSDVRSLKKNVKKSQALLNASNSGAKDPDLDASSSIDSCLELLEKIESSHAKTSAEMSAFKKAKHVIIDLLDKRSGLEVKNMAVSSSDQSQRPAAQPVAKTDVASSRRQQMGLLESLSLTSLEYKKLAHAREQYMADAMTLKEEMERQRRKENKEDDDDDDDDEDDDDDVEDDVESTKKPNGKAATATKEEVAAAVVASDEAANGKFDASVETKASPEKADSVSAVSEEKSTDEKRPAEQAAKKAGGDSEGAEAEDLKGAAIDQSKAVKQDGVVTAMDVDDEAKDTKDVVKEAQSAGKDEPKVEENGVSSDPSSPPKIGKLTEYDEFCEDMPTAPELIRRCLAVLRSLAQAGPSEPFIYPVDPQTNPGYYDMVLRPMCLWKAGKELQAVGKKLSKTGDKLPDESSLPKEAESVVLDESSVLEAVETAVLQFGRNIRFIVNNCLSYANAGPMVISAGGEFLRIFERLFLDWVIAPTHLLTPLDELDDDRCVEHHESDEQSTVLLCDGCEGNFNISRLDPPLTKVPSGDWYCPRCVNGRCWPDLDPRIGETVQRSVPISGETPDKPEIITSAGGTNIVRKGEVKKCFFLYPEGGETSKPSLVYDVKMTDGTSETWTLEQVDESLKSSGKAKPPVRCIWAIAESQGYGCQMPGKTLARELVPVPLNPNISDAAAQAVVRSSVFRDTISASGTLLLVNPEDMKSDEWLRLLLLLVMKCSSSDVMQNLASKLENEAAEVMAKHLESLGKVSDIADVLDDIDDGDEKEEENDKVEVGDSTERVQNTGVEEEDQEAEEQETGGANVDDEGESETKNNVSPPTTPLNGQGTSATIEVEPIAVEVVNETAGGPTSQENGVAQESKEVVVVDPIKEKRSAALAEKSKRQKAREDSFSAFSIKNQLRPTVASFEEDAVSQVVDSALASKFPGLSFASTCCRNTVCDFCGLTDIALGSPLMRVPDESEWSEITPHASRSRRVHLIASMQGKGISDDDTATQDLELKKPHLNKMVSLSIRIGGELVSEKAGRAVFDRTEDGGMLEFCPRNSEGFQNELLFRSENNLPFVTGSLSAHECCSIAAHKARKVHVVQRFRERQLELVEANAGMSCGRTLAIGKDFIGRFYWKFHNEQDSLFVFVPKENDSSSSGNGMWHRFADPESIASVIMGLGKDVVVKDLKRAYPAAAQMCKDGTWTSAIWKRHFPNAWKAAKENDAESSDQESSSDKMEEDEEIEVPFEVDEKVLVESKSGKLLWDARVMEVMQKRADGPVTAYKVRYQGWSSRFDEWVDGNRLVEPSENNRQVQEEMLEESAALRDGIPSALNDMVAKGFLRARDRARGQAPLPDFANIAHTSVGASTDDRTFAVMKAALLLIETALPIGAVDNTSKGNWRPEIAEQWRLMVESAVYPATLLRCAILLEDVITEEWLKTDVGHMRSCLPNRWKALNEASAASLAIRITLLDRGIVYDSVDKKRFVEPTNKKKK